METPPSIPESFTPDTPKARHAIDQALAEGRGWLTASEAHAVLDAYTIPAAPLKAWASSGPNGNNEPSLTVSEKPALHRSGVYDLMIEAFDDLQFGPVIRFGFGIPDAEFSHTREFALPPLSLHLAKELIARARFVSRSCSRENLRGVDVESLALTLVKVSQIIIDIDEIAELSIHSLLDLDGVFGNGYTDQSSQGQSAGW